VAFEDQSSTSLQFAHCSDALCSTVTIVTVAEAGVAGQKNSIAIGTDGLPLIVHHEVDSQTVRVVHCANEFCLSYFDRK
jgi:hypothetical protein